MEQELRRVYYDPELGVEACLFRGIDQGFPEHFHTYYVIGTMDRGSREVTIAGETLRLAPGELVFFQPGEPHARRPVGEERLDWRGLHVPQEVMERAAEAVTGRQFAPHFTPSVLPGSELTSLFREVWELVAGEQGELRREEAFLLLVGRLLERCGGCPRPPEEVRPEVRAVCDYLEAHCDRRITLEQLSTLAGLSKYHLLRCFTRQKGITPYRYLETVRVNRARALLEQGATPLDAALRAGFADQSHFNHFFKILTGLTPSQYRAVFAAERGEP